MRKFLLSKTGGAAAVFASALAFGAVAPANAADFGGDCCADLEERIAELEATTVRKGNRKVSLTISGHVNEMVLFWDDGHESNVYQVTNELSETRFRFKGSAKVTADVSAGYYLEFGIRGAGSFGVDQDNDDARGGFFLRQSNWWIQSEQLGRITVGEASPATDDIILAAVAGTGTGVTSDLRLVYGGFQLRDTAGNLLGTTLGSFTPGLDTARRNIVRYDTPTFGGFKLVAAWGEDDFWDVALWYAGQLGDFRVAGGIGYLQDTDGPQVLTVNSPDFEEIKGSFSILHTPTGLFLDGAYDHRETDAVGRADFDYYYIRAGIRANLTPLGPTVFWGNYALGEDGITGALTGLPTGLASVTSSEVETWGLGINQHLSAAAMEVYLGYLNVNADVNGLDAANVAQNLDLEDYHFVYTGARIKF